MGNNYINQYKSPLEINIDNKDDLAEFLNDVEKGIFPDDFWDISRLTVDEINNQRKMEKWLTVCDMADRIKSVFCYIPEYDGLPGKETAITLYDPQVTFKFYERDYHGKKIYEKDKIDSLANKTTLKPVIREGKISLIPVDIRKANLSQALTWLGPIKRNSTIPVDYVDPYTNKRIYTYPLLNPTFYYEVKQQIRQRIIMESRNNNKQEIAYIKVSDVIFDDNGNILQDGMEIPFYITQNYTYNDNNEPTYRLQFSGKSFEQYLNQRGAYFRSGISTNPKVARLQNTINNLFDANDPFADDILNEASDLINRRVNNIPLDTPVTTYHNNKEGQKPESEPTNDNLNSLDDLGSDSALQMADNESKPNIIKKRVKKNKIFKKK